MSENITEGAATIVRDLTMQAKAQHLTLTDGRSFLVRHDMMAVDDVTGPDWTPPIRSRKEAHVAITRKQSLIDYLLTHKTADTVVFANAEGASFRALIDYHGAKTVGAREHEASLQLAYSEAWKRWEALEKRANNVPQQDFLLFLEENIVDIVTPEPATIREVVMDFTVKRKVDFQQALRMSNGDLEFTYAEEKQGTNKSGTIAIPTLFTLSIPVFEGESQVSLNVHLRWRLDDGKLTFGIERWRPVFVRNAMVDQIAHDIVEATGAPVLHGPGPSAQKEPPRSARIR